MKTKNIIYLFLLAFALVTVGCSDDPIIEKAEENLFNVAGATIAVSGVSGGEYNIADLDKTPITFDVTSRGEAVSSLNMYVSYNGGARQLVKSISSLPSSESYNIDEAAAAAGVDPGDLKPGDTFSFSFGEVVTASGEYLAGPTVNILVVTIFKSALAGVFDCVTTVTSQGAGIGWDQCGDDAVTWEGTVEWVRNQTDPNADGNYTVLTTAASGENFDDTSHGAYYACYGTDAQGNLPNTGTAGDLFVSDVDGVISIPGASQWGEVFSVSNLSVNGGVLTFNWTNDYGEGALVQLTRTDGADWPADLSN